MISWVKKILLLMLAPQVSGYFTHCTAIDNQQQKSVIAQARLRLGFAYLEQGDYRLAKQNILSAIEYSPNDYQGYLAMASYQQQLEEYSLAEQSYQLAIILAPKNTTVRNNYGAFLCHLGQYTKGLQQFTLLMDPQENNYFGDDLAAIGYCYLGLGQCTDTKALLIRWLKYDPKRGNDILVVAKKYLQQKKIEQVKGLLYVYQQALPATAEYLQLQLSLAELEDQQ